MHFSLCDSVTITDPVAWVEHHTISVLQSRQDFSFAIVAVSNLDSPNFRFALLDGEYRPLITAAEQRSDRYFQGIVGIP